MKAALVNTVQVRRSYARSEDGGFAGLTIWSLAVVSLGVTAGGAPRTRWTSAVTMSQRGLGRSDGCWPLTSWLGLRFDRPVSGRAA